MRLGCWHASLIVVLALICTVCASRLSSQDVEFIIFPDETGTVLKAVSNGNGTFGTPTLFTSFGGRIVRGWGRR